MSGSPGPEVPDSLNISDDAPPPLLSAMQTDLSPVEGSSRYSSDSPPHLVKASTPEYTQSPLDLTSAETSVITTQTRPGNPHRGTEETTSPNRRHFEPPLSHATLSTISASALLPTFVTKRTLQPSPSRPSVASQRRKTLPGPSIRPKTPSAPRPSLDNSAKVMRNLNEFADYQQAMAAAAGMVPFFSLQPGGTMQMNFPQVAFAQQQMVAQQAAVSNAFSQAQDPNRPGPSMLPPNFLLAFQQQQQQNQHQFQLQQQQQQHQQRQQAQHQQQQLQQQHQQQLQQQQLQHQLQQQQNQQQFQIHFATIPQQSLSLGQPQQQPQFLIQQQLPQLVVQQLEAQQAPKSVQPKRQRAQKPQPERQQNNQSLNNIIGIAQTSQPNLILSPMNAPTSSTTSNAGVRLSTSVNPADQATPLLLRPQPKRPVHAGHANPALAAALATTSPVITTPQPSHAPTPASQQQFISIPVAQQLGTQEQLGFLQQVPSIVFTGATSAQLQQQYQQQTTPSVITTARPRAQIGGLRLPIQEEADDRPPVLERNVPQPIDLTSLPASSNGQPKRPPLLITNKFTGLTDAFAQEAAANRYRRELECAKRGEPIITRHFIGGMVIEESSKPFKFSDAEEDDSGSSESSEDDVIEVCDDGVVKQIESLNLNAQTSTEEQPVQNAVITPIAQCSNKRITAKSPSPQPGPSGIKLGKIKHKAVRKKKTVVPGVSVDDKTRLKMKLARQELGTLAGVHNVDRVPRSIVGKVRARVAVDRESSQDVSMEQGSANEDVMSPALLVDTRADDVPRERFCLRCAIPLTARTYSRCPMFCTKECKKVFKKFQKRILAGKGAEDRFFEDWNGSGASPSLEKKQRKPLVKTPKALSSLDKSDRSLNTPTTSNRIVVVFKKSPTDDSISASLPNSPTAKFVPSARNTESMGWSVDQVAEWVNAVTGYPPCAEYVREHEIDGCALAALAFGESQNTPFKLGPAIKLRAALSELKEQLKTVDIARFTLKDNPELIGKPLTEWTYADVVVLVKALTGCESIANVFQQEEVDGCALVLLEERCLLEDLNVMKEGHQLKIMSAIKELKALCGA